MWLEILYAFVGLVLLTWLVDWLRRIPWMSGLHKKCVLITGCDSGFGNALAKSLHSRGVFVFAGCYTDGGAEKLAEETGERVKTFKLDVSDTSSIEEGYKFVKENLPSGTVLWGLVNNAGVAGAFGPCELHSRGDLLSVMDVNCFGMAEMVRVFLPLLKQSRGRIVNTSSTNGLVSTPGSIPYMISKFAAVGYSEALRHEKAVWGIKVCTICPGAFKTPILNMDQIRENTQKKWENLDPRVKAEYGQDAVDKVCKMLQDTVDTVGKDDVSPVLDAYEHSLFAVYPMAIYIPGLDGKVIVFSKKWAPSLFEYLIQWSWARSLPITRAKE